MVSVADLMRYIFYLTPVQTPICQNFALWIAKDIKKKPELNRCYLYYYLICTFSPIFQKSYWFLELAFLCVWIKDLAQSIFWTCFTNQPTNPTHKITTKRTTKLSICLLMEWVIILQSSAFKIHTQGWHITVN